MPFVRSRRSGARERQPLRLAIGEAERALAAAGVASPRVDAELLAAHVLGRAARAAAAAPARRRRAGRAAGRAGRPAGRPRTAAAPARHGRARPGQVAVGPGVFIPRPETELLLEWGLAAIADVVGAAGRGPVHRLRRARARRGARAARTRVVHAVEADPGALSWARHNIAEHVAAGGSPVTLHAADVRWPDLLVDLEARVDLVLCNPPYVPEAPRCRPRWPSWDPPDAVFGGPDGLEIIRAVIAAAAGLLRYGGDLAIEHDDTHGEPVPALLRGAGCSPTCSAPRPDRPAPVRHRPRGSGDRPPASAARKLPTVPATYDCPTPTPGRTGWPPRPAPCAPATWSCCPPTPSTASGCDAFSAAAVRALLAAKRRGPDMPVPVLVGSWSTIDGLVLGLPRAARDLIEAFWPGGLSLVLPHAPSLAWDLGETKGTVMLRMPLHPVALELLRDVGPMAVSSANVSGCPPATTAAEAQAQLGDAVAVYLDGGPSGEPVASTIVDLTAAEPRILRAGACRPPRSPRCWVARCRSARRYGGPSPASIPSSRPPGEPSARAGPRPIGGRTCAGRSRRPREAVRGARVPLSACDRAEHPVLGPGFRRPLPPGPGDRRGRARRARAAARRAAADRQREPDQPGGARRARLDAVQQVRGGLPGPPLLRWLPGGRPGRGDRERAGQGAVRRRPRQPAAALGCLGELRRVRRVHPARRHGAGDGPQAGRAPHPRQQGQLLRQVVQRGALHGPPGHRADRLRPGPRPGPRAPPEDDHRRRHGVPAADRLRRVPGDRRRGRREARGGRRALHRPGGRQGHPVAGALRRRGQPPRTRCCAARAAA